MIGRFLAVGLMIGGIAVLGVMTASVASWLVDNVSSATATEVEAAEAPLREEIAGLADLIQNLSAQLKTLPVRSASHSSHEAGGENHQRRCPAFDFLWIADMGLHLATGC